MVLSAKTVSVRFGLAQSGESRLIRRFDTALPSKSLPMCRLAIMTLLQEQLGMSFALMRCRSHGCLICHTEIVAMLEPCTWSVSLLQALVSVHRLASVGIS